MIGDFHYSREPRADAVNLRMAWRDSVRMGSLVLAPPLLERLAAGDYPALDAEPMGFPSALSYALFLALHAGIPLVLTGDSSVWNPDWGRLSELSAAGHQSLSTRRSARH